MSDETEQTAAAFEVQYVITKPEHRWPINKSVMVVTRGNADRACAIVLEQNPEAVLHQVIRRSSSKEVILDV